MWLISFFPAKHLCIDNYIAVKNYLLSFGVKKLEQTGNVYVENGEKFKSRKKTSNKWFETQDSISYWDNFCKPKIVYREISQTMEACLINEPMFLNNKCYFITCDKLEYVLAFLNSKLFEKIILSKTNQTGGRGRNFIESIKLIPPSKNEYEEFTKLYSDFVNNKTTESCFDEFFFNMYELTEEEKKYLNN